MKITFISNFMNHHQLPFCLEMANLLGSNFKFIATQKIDRERIDLGYQDMNNKFEFIIRAYENEKEAIKLALDSDIVIIGSAPDKYIRQRLKRNKISFRYSERVFKKGFRIKTFLSILYKRSYLERKNTFLLSTSPYSYNDFSIAGAYKNKSYKWGYFPEFIRYEDIKYIIDRKRENSIVWVGRLIELKHPEVVIEVAKKLKQNNYDFNINMIGIGNMSDNIKKHIEINDLSNNIKLLGSMEPKKVRKYMETSEIFLFTSDRNEGWGAVLNESMNSGCAIVASHMIGSVPYLVKNNKNGIIYMDGDTDDLYKKVVLLITHKAFRKKLGYNAYNTIKNTWNPSIAAKRLVDLSKYLLDGSNFKDYKEGPCSKAEVLKNNWYNNR